MKEELISFETAKLAKEKGFKESCLYYFSLEGIEKSFCEDGLYFYSSGEGGRLILRPTQSLLQKWLREVHNIDITIMIVAHTEYEYYIHKNRDRVANNNIKCTYENHKCLYEATLEQALQEALKLIKIEQK